MGPAAAEQSDEHVAEMLVDASNEASRRSRPCRLISPMAWRSLRDGGDQIVRSAVAPATLAPSRRPRLRRRKLTGPMASRSRTQAFEPFSMSSMSSPLGRDRPVRPIGRGSGRAFRRSARPAFGRLRRGDVAASRRIRSSRAVANLCSASLRDVRAASRHCSPSASRAAAAAAAFFGGGQVIEQRLAFLGDFAWQRTSRSNSANTVSRRSVNSCDGAGRRRPVRSRRFVGRDGLEAAAAIVRLAEQSVEEAPRFDQSGPPFRQIGPQRGNLVAALALSVNPATTARARSSLAIASAEIGPQRPPVRPGRPGATGLLPLSVRAGLGRRAIWPLPPRPV